MPGSLFHRRAPAYGIRAADDATPEILLYDEIGFFGIRAQQFVADLRAITAPTIHLRVNSPGGDVFEGVAIYNALLSHPAEIITHVDGIAASIASVVALAGDEVRMARNAMFMIHEAHGGAWGTAEDLRRTADLIEKVGDATVLRAYLDHTSEDEAQLRAWMKEEHWFDADEAVEAGFADQIEEQEALAARFDLSVFTRVPDRLAAMARPAKRDAEYALRDAGLSRREAKEILAHRPIPAAPALRDAEDDRLLTPARRLVAAIRGA